MTTTVIQRIGVIPESNLKARGTTALLEEIKKLYSRIKQDEDLSGLRLADIGLTRKDECVEVRFYFEHV